MHYMRLFFYIIIFNNSQAHALTSIIDLPHDIIVNIINLSAYDLKDLGALRLVDKCFKDNIDSAEEKLFYNKLLEYKDLKGEKSWRDFVQEKNSLLYSIRHINNLSLNETNLLLNDIDRVEKILIINVTNYIINFVNKYKINNIKELESIYIAHYVINISASYYAAIDIPFLIFKNVTLLDQTITDTMYNAINKVFEESAWDKIRKRLGDNSCTIAKAAEFNDCFSTIHKQAEEWITFFACDLIKNNIALKFEKNEAYDIAYKTSQLSKFFVLSFMAQKQKLYADYFDSAYNITLDALDGGFIRTVNFSSSSSEEAEEEYEKNPYIHSFKYIMKKSKEYMLENQKILEQKT